MTARTLLNWSDEEFWDSTPRKFYAFLYTYVELQTESSQIVTKQQALVGKDALAALSQISSQIR